MDVFERLLRAPPEAPEIASLAAWWAIHRDLARELERPVELALIAGSAMDRLGYAFASGYQAAGAALFGPCARPAAFCATEGGSAHPRDMRASLERTDAGLVLNGDKSFVTLGSFAEIYLIVASEGLGDDGRNRLRLVRIDRRPGLRVVPLPEGPFVPEIPHASLELRGVAVADDEVLPGDGYARYLKPFRTVEDIHVHAALVGWLVRIARLHASDALVERLLGAAAAIACLAAADPASAGAHLALAGAVAQLHATVDELAPMWAAAAPKVRARWERDRALLQVAGRARAKRRESAWARLRHARA